MLRRARRMPDWTSDKTLFSKKIKTSRVCVALKIFSSYFSLTNVKLRETHVNQYPVEPLVVFKEHLVAFSLTFFESASNLNPQPNKNFKKLINRMSFITLSLSQGSGVEKLSETGQKTTKYWYKIFLLKHILLFWIYKTLHK